MSTRPKSCPFCGRDAVEQAVATLEWGVWEPAVGCEKCGVWFVSERRGTALRRWNRRATPQEET